MNGLNQVRDAVVEALRAAGVTAVAAYEGAAKRYTGAVAAVDVASALGKPAGLQGYLGQRLDPETGAMREMYGMQMEASISLELRAVRAADCEAAMERAAEVLTVALPAGLRVGEVSWTGIAWDKETGMFLRKGSVACRAAFLAEGQPQEEGAFRDFILKGTVRHEHNEA